MDPESNPSHNGQGHIHYLYHCTTSISSFKFSDIVWGQKVHGGWSNTYAIFRNWFQDLDFPLTVLSSELIKLGKREENLYCL